MARLAQREQWSDSDLVFDMMATQGLNVDIQVATIYACILAHQVNVEDLMKLRQSMKDSGIDISISYNISIDIDIDRSIDVDIDTEDAR
jgi:hypothetical protein